MLDFLVENTQEEETMAVDKRQAQQMKYAKENLRQIKFMFHCRNDADILEKLDTVANKQGYIKSLIRADIAGGSAEKMGDLIERLRAIERALEGLDL